MFGYHSEAMVKNESCICIKICKILLKLQRSDRLFTASLFSAHERNTSVALASTKHAGVGGGGGYVCERSEQDEIEKL